MAWSGLFLQPFLPCPFPRQKQAACFWTWPPVPLQRGFWWGPREMAEMIAFSDRQGVFLCLRKGATSAREGSGVVICILTEPQTYVLIHLKMTLLYHSVWKWRGLANSDLFKHGNIILLLEAPFG